MKRRQIFIELTSLLDVILIMLFILLIQAKTTTAQAIDASAQAETAAAEIFDEVIVLIMHNDMTKYVKDAKVKVLFDLYGVSYAE